MREPCNRKMAGHSLYLQHNYLLLGIIITFVFHVLAVIDPNTILLNSCERCAANKKYEVTSDLGYSVNVNPIEEQTCQWECKAHFYSARKNGWLCLAQVGIQSKINDTNGQMSVYDSTRKGTPLVHLTYIPSAWNLREICTQTSFMDFELKRVNEQREIDFGHLQIHFRVLDIESRDRRLYLEDTFCSTAYKLLNSQISIYNHPVERDPVTLDDPLNFLCGVPIEMVEVNEQTDKRICFVYLPSEQVNCGSNWQFSVSLAGYSRSPEHMAYTLKCNEDRARSIHAWCADKGTHKVTVIFQRSTNIPKTGEQPEMFHYIVRDYNGSAESLLMEFEQQQSPPKEGSSMTNVLIILIIVPCLVLVGIVVTLLYRKKLFVLWKQYGPVHNPGNGNAV